MEKSAGLSLPLRSAPERESRAALTCSKNVVEEEDLSRQLAAVGFASIGAEAGSGAFGTINQATT